MNVLMTSLSGQNCFRSGLYHNSFNMLSVFSYYDDQHIYVPADHITQIKCHIYLRVIIIRALNSQLANWLDNHPIRKMKLS